MNKLKPCPWCGKEPKTTLGRATNVVSIYCDCPMKPCVSIAVDYAIINNRQQPPTTEQLNFAESKAEYIWNQRPSTLRDAVLEAIKDQQDYECTFFNDGVNASLEAATQAFDEQLR